MDARKFNSLCQRIDQGGWSRIEILETNEKSRYVIRASRTCGASEPTTITLRAPSFGEALAALATASPPVDEPPVTDRFLALRAAVEVVRIHADAKGRRVWHSDDDRELAGEIAEAAETAEWLREVLARFPLDEPAIHDFGCRGRS